MPLDITQRHPLYDDYAPSWRLMRDAADGEEAVKLAGALYLPMPSSVAAIDDVAGRAAAFESYKTRAEFPEIVQPTIRGALGMMHFKPAQITLPAALEYLREKATADGLTLDGFHQRITAEILTTGRYGVLPGIGDDGNPLLGGYAAETIINWDVVDKQPVYVVLDESTIARDPETNFWDEVAVFRELSLDDGVFQSRLWRGARGEAMAGDWERGALARTGSALPFLPFVFIDTMDLTPDPDDVPLYGLARIARRLYMLDADYQQSLHLTSQPTPWVSGYDDPQQAIRDGEVPKSIGSAVIWVLPANGSCGYLEFSGAGLGAQREAIAAAKETAVMFGAQMFADTRRTAESGEALRLRLTSETATFRQIAVTAAAGLERALRYAAQWRGLDPASVEVKPYLEFVEHTLDPVAVDSLVRSWQAGAFSWETLFERLQEGKIIPAERTSEDEQALLEDERERALDAQEDAMALLPRNAAEEDEGEEGDLDFAAEREAGTAGAERPRANGSAAPARAT